MNASDLHTVLTALERYHDKRWEEAREASRESVADDVGAYVKKLRLDAEIKLKETFDAYRKALISAANLKSDASHDPEIPDRRFVPLPPDDRLPDNEEEAMAGFDDQDRLKLLALVWDPNAGLTPQGREIITRRVLRRDTCEDIAKTIRPPMSGPAQVYKIWQRETQKLKQRFSKVPNDLE
jgi:hypothetical protein